MVDESAIAVIADAHFHDIRSEYGFAGIQIAGRPASIRSWQDTRRSSRVFNESRDALITALDDVSERGVRHVVLLGDYTDDGQREASKQLTRLLHQYRQEHGMRFYAIPGNHDFYGPAGKHQSTRFVTKPGATVLVTSDPKVAATEPQSAILTDAMYCEGSPQALLPMGDFGLFNQAEYRYWESPFGQSDALESRMFDAQSADGSVTHRLMDASYLVEPYDGVWLLMIDANVFEPRNGGIDPNRKNSFYNSSDAGWNAVLRVKPFLIDWIESVCQRAQQSGKQLLAFSHYPVIDPIDKQTKSESCLFKGNEATRRTPDLTVADTLLATGLPIHFSGHMHIDSTEQHQVGPNTLINVSVPSLVAFPAGYKLIELNDKGYSFKTVSIDATPLNNTLLEYYREESLQSGFAIDSALHAETYGDFLYKRMRTRVRHHYLVKEWPDVIVQEIEKTTAADLAYFLLARATRTDALRFCAKSEFATSEELTQLSTLAALYGISSDDFHNCPMMTLISDWYCLRYAGQRAYPYIGATRLQTYTCLAESCKLPGNYTAEPSAAFLNELVSDFTRTITGQQ